MPLLTPLHLHAVLNDDYIGLRRVAAQVGLSPAGLSRLARHGQWPKRRDPAKLRRAISTALAGLGVPTEQLDRLFDLQDRTCTEVPSALPPLRRTHRDRGAVADSATNLTTHEQEETMLIAQQPLTTDARKHFRLFVGPFDDEVLLDAHFFTNDQIRLVREMVWQTALNARMLALVGESGSGKTTILADLKERIAREAKPMRVIAPSVAAMAEKDDRGKPLKSSDILATMVMALDERATVAQTSEARKRQVLRLLGESAKAGYAHLLVIEEAHDAPRATLNQLKRLYEEMRTTRQPLLSVLLLGHPELADKLQKHDVREVLQRMAIVELPPLNVKAGELLAYMRHRVKAYCGRELEELFDAGAVAALANRLQGDVYPLAINNLANRALNKAAELGAPFVTADVAVMP